MVIQIFFIPKCFVGKYHSSPEKKWEAESFCCCYFKSKMIFTSTVYIPQLRHSHGRPHVVRGQSRWRAKLGAHSEMGALLKVTSVLSWSGHAFLPPTSACSFDLFHGPVCQDGSWAVDPLLPESNWTLKSTETVFYFCPQFSHSEYIHHFGAEWQNKNEIPPNLLCSAATINSHFFSL